jgi:hypothetical protein
MASGFLFAASLAHARHALPPVWPCASRGAGRYPLCYAAPLQGGSVCGSGRQRPWQMAVAAQRQRPAPSRPRPPPAFGRQRCRLDFVIAASLAHARHALPPVWPYANRGAGRYSLCCAPYKKPMCRPGRQRPWQSPPTSGLRPSSRRRNRKVR